MKLCAKRNTHRLKRLVQVLGIKPQEEACTQATPQLAASFMDYMKAGDDSALKAEYTRHLAILVSPNKCNGINYNPFLPSSL